MQKILRELYFLRKASRKGFSRFCFELNCFLKQGHSQDFLGGFSICESKGGGLGLSQMLMNCAHYNGKINSTYS